MRIVIVGLLLAVVGCGGGADAPAASTNGGSGGTVGAPETTKLEGQWILEDRSCATIWTFKGATWELDLICEASTSAANMEAHVGTFTASGSSLSFIRKDSTCASDGRPNQFAMGYDFSGGDLRLIDASGITLLQKFQPSSSSGGSGVSVAFGCFDDKGNFAAHPIGPVGGQ